jgi:protocatechuate 3,4-dioxygenase beta subunit
MDDHHDHDRGLRHDLETLALMTQSRRKVLQWASAGVLAAAGCSADVTGEGGSGGNGSGGNGSGGTPLGGSSFGGSGSGTCSEIPEETAGPYPGDGTNGPNALAMSGIVRSDITESLAGGGIAEGIPLTVRLRLVDVAAGCEALAGAAVYLWHCDRAGNYSMYSQAAVDETYLRGVQEADADGVVTFTTIFPACYSGRWPHIHFEIYSSLADATSGDNAIAVSQLALPEAVCDEVFATDGYEQSIGNMGQVSLESDNVFSDGAVQQLADVSGSVASGFIAELSVGI